MPKLPTEDHIARYCSAIYTNEGEIMATAFMLKPTEDYLSVNWIEHLKCINRENEIAMLRNIYKTKNLKGKAAKIGVMKVGDVLDRIIPRNPKIEIRHNPAPPDLSHSGIFNLEHDDLAVAELIRQTLLQTYPFRQ